MALNAYLVQVESLLDDFGNVEYTQANLTTYINEGRLQIALASESIRSPAILALTATIPSYLFSAATFPSGPDNPGGIGQVINVRMALVQLATGGQRRLEMRSWEYFQTFYLARTVPLADNPYVGPGGQPAACARLQPGLAGTLWVAPTPDQSYTLNLDAVATPIPLVDDHTIDALQQPWSEAVQFYAAAFALFNAQRYADADAMWRRYGEFEMRATQMTTPSRLPRIYPGGAGAHSAAEHMPLTHMPGRGR